MAAPPEHGGSSAAPGIAERLAAVSGATIMREPMGETSVVFPARGTGSPSITAPGTAVAARAQSGPIAAPRPVAPSLQGAAPSTSAHEAERERAELYEDLYESFMERFRRDLLHERERSGHLVDDLF